MKNNFIKKLITLSIAGLCLVIYLLLRHFTGFYIPCFIHRTTGFKCPGCGVTHMLDAMLFLNFEAARKANPFIFYTLPFLIYELIYEIFLPHRNKRLYHINNILLLIYCIAFSIFGIVRNFTF
ncbi:MAG: DUF2752 domain-containing protein [Lachnospiraceae bacterium]|nr:DUF2752 domain-containing protein [Lachnospiraceae bacterium]